MKRERYSGEQFALAPVRCLRVGPTASPPPGVAKETVVN